MNGSSESQSIKGAMRVSACKPPTHTHIHTHHYVISAEWYIECFQNRQKMTAEMLSIYLHSPYCPLKDARWEQSQCNDLIALNPLPDLLTHSHTLDFLYRASQQKFTLTKEDSLRNTCHVESLRGNSQRLWSLSPLCHVYRRCKVPSLSYITQELPPLH